MAGPVWRNIDVPNLLPAISGVSTASNLLNNAVQGGLGMVDTFRTNVADQADRIIAARMLQEQNLDGYQAALQSGSLLGQEGGRASLGMLQALDNRVGTLQERAVATQRLATGQESLEQTRWSNKRTKDGQALIDAANPDLAQARILARNNDQAGLEQLLANSQTLRALRPEDLNTLLTSTDSLAESNMNRTATTLSNTVSAYNFGSRVRNEAESERVSGAVTEVVRNSANLEDATLASEQAMQGMNAREKQQFINGVRAQGYNIYAPTGTAAPDGTGSGFVQSIPFPQTRNYVTKIIHNVGEVTGTNREKAAKILPFLIDAESGGNPNAVGPETSGGRGRARGLTQLMPATARELERKLGMPEGETDRNPAANRRAGEAFLIQMLDKYNGNVEQALAAYNAGPRTVDGWLNPPASESRGVNQVLTENLNQRRGNNITSEYLGTQADSLSTAAGVAAQLKANNPGLQSASDDEIAGRIQRIIQESGQANMTPATAGRILERSLGQGTNAVGDFLGRVWNASPAHMGISQFTDALTYTPNIGSFGVNGSAVNQAVADYRSGTTSEQVRANNELQVLIQRQAGAEQARQAAEAAVASLVERVRSNPNLAPSLERARMRLDQANAASTQMNEAILSNPAYLATFERTQRPRPQPRGGTGSF